MKFNTIKRTTKNVIIVLMAGLFVSSCSDYLDVVPDNVPTLDHAFAMLCINKLRFCRQ